MMGTPMKPGAWCMRFTPYGTTHVATWASIIRHVARSSPERAHSLLTSLKEDAGSTVLGCTAMGRRLHPARAREGREAPESVHELLRMHEGQYLEMLLCGSEEVVSSGNCLRSCMGSQIVGVSVGNTKYVPGEHWVRPVKRRRG